MPSLNKAGLSASIEELSERVALLEREAGAAQSLTAKREADSGASGGPREGMNDQTLVRALAELQISLEELRVADDHIQQQQDAIARVHTDTLAERRHYARLFELAPEGYLVTNAQGVILEANRAAVVFLNVRSGYLLGKPALNYIALPDRRWVRQQLLALSPRPDRAPESGERPPASPPAVNDGEAHVRVTPSHTTAFDAVLRLTGVYDAQTGALTSVYWAIQDITERNRAETERYRLFMDTIEDYAIFIMDENGNVLQWNRGATRLYGYQASEIVGRSAACLYPPEEGSAARLQSELAIAREKGRKEEDNWYIRKNGTRLYAEGTLMSLRFGNRPGFAKVMRDRTREKRAGDELLAAFQTTEEVLSSIADGFYAVSGDWRITYVNHRTEDLWGKNRRELLGAHLWDVFPGGTETTAYQEHQQAFRTRETVEFTNYIPEQNIWTEVNIYPGASGMSVYFRDITARKQAEEALRAAHETLEERVAVRTADLADANRRLAAEIRARELLEAERRAALARIVEVQEEERRRISREMHDQMGQHLTALSLGLQTLKTATPPGAEITPLLARMQEVTESLGREAHRIAVALRPTALDDLGLVNALRGHIEEWREHTGVRAEFHVTPVSDGATASDGYRFLSGEIQTTLYRVVQEALNNIAKHADARSVSVLLRRTSEMVFLIVEDDGKGFDAVLVTPESNGDDDNGDSDDANRKALVVAGDDAPVPPGPGEPGSRARRNLGLLGMRERIALVGGTLDMESASGQGTTLYVRVPIGPNE